MCDGYAGAEGKVDESIALMKEVEDLKAKKRMAEVTKYSLFHYYFVEINVMVYFQPGE